MKRVLIIDDSIFMRLYLKTILERNDFEVVGEAENGAIGVQKYIKCQPDLVTLDITMPGKGGIEALKEIISINPEAKVVMLSAMGQESLVHKAIMIGAKSFIVKPFKKEIIIKTLKGVLAI